MSQLKTTSAGISAARRPELYFRTKSHERPFYMHTNHPTKSQVDIIASCPTGKVLSKGRHWAYLGSRLLLGGIDTSAVPQAGILSGILSYLSYQWSAAVDIKIGQFTVSESQYRPTSRGVVITPHQRIITPHQRKCSVTSQSQLGDSVYRTAQKGGEKEVALISMMIRLLPCFFSPELIKFYKL